MALQLGNLSAGIELDTSGFDQNLDRVESRMRALGQSMESATKQKLDVAPTGADKLDQATQKVDRATAAKKNASREKLDVTPLGGEKVDQATQQVDKVTASKKAASKEKLDVAPVGTEKITQATKATEELERASRKAQEATAPQRDATGGAFYGLMGSAKAALPVVTALGAAGIAVNKGWARLESIDTATYKLQGLGHGTESVANIMDSALQSVRGTAFGLGDAVTSAANAVASGVAPGEELTQVLTTMADVSAISGAELTDMGMIFNSVLAKGKLQGDDMLQLLGRGVPVLQMIGDELGVTAAEASKMATDGAISFEIFESAMRNGVGGAAQEMGASMRGSMDNAGAAVGRLGAAIADPVFKSGPGIISGFTDAVDGMTTFVDAAYGAWEKVPGPIKVVIASLAAVTVAQKALGTEMGAKFLDKLTSGGKGFEKLGTGMATAYYESVMLNPEFGKMARGMDTAKNSAKNLGSGLMGALGGPWGLAIAGATAALGIFMNEVRKTKQAQEEAARATDEWADLFRDADGAITESIQKHALLRVEQADVADQMDKLGMSQADLAAGVLDLDGSYEGLIGQLDRIIEQGNQDPTAWRGRRYTDEAKAAQDLRAELVRMHGEVEEGAEKSRTAADVSNELAQKIADSASAAESSTGGFSTFSSVLDAMAADAKTADDAIKNMAVALMGLSDDPQVRLQAYLADAAESVQGLKDLLAEGMGGFDMDTGFFDVDTEQGRDMTRYMEGLRSELHMVTAAQYEASTTMGESGVGAMEAASETARKYTEDLREQFRAAGRGEEEINKLIETWGLSPETVVTEFHAEGLETATALAEGLNAEMTNINEDSHTIVVDSSALKLTEEELKEMGYSYEKLGDNLIEITADNSAAKVALNEVADLTRDLGTADNTVVFRADVTTLAKALEAVDDLTVKYTTNPAEFPLVANTEAARKAVEELELEATSINGMLYIEDSTPENMKNLLELGAQTKSLPEGNILIEDPTPEILEMLEILGFVTTNLPNGEVLLDHEDLNTAIREMQNLEVLVEGGAEGTLVINEDILKKEENLKQLKALTERGAKGSHVISDNVPAVKNNVNSLNSLPATRSKHIVQWEADRTAYFASIGQAANVQGPAPVVPGRQDGGTVPHPGYRLPTTGPGTDRRDGFLGLSAMGVPTAMVDGGEWVINRNDSERFNNVFEAGNRGDVDGMFRALLAHLPAHQDGGQVSKRVKSDLSGMAGTPHIFGGWSPSGVDCTGATSLVVNSALDLPLFESRHATMNAAQWLPAKGLKPGQGDGDDLVIGFYNGGPGGGHAAARLPDGTYVESGGNTGGGLTIGGKAGPLSGRGFTDFWHLPYSMDGSSALTGDGGTTAGGMGTTIKGGDFRASFNPIDIKDGASGIGSSIGRSVSVGSIANNAGSSGTVGSAIGGAASSRIASVAAQHGYEAEAQQLIEAALPNWDVWLRVSPDTIKAFNEVGEAEAARTNARLDVVDAEQSILDAQKQLAETSEASAEKVQDARDALAEAQNAEKPDAKKIETAQKKLDKILKEVPEDAADAAEAIAAAERNLTQRRRDEERAILDLENAQKDYNDAIIAAPFLAAASWIDTLSTGFGRLSESMGLLNENMLLVQQATESRMDAEIADIRAQQDLQDATENAARTRRDADGQAHDDAMSVRAAEWELSKAREEAARIGNQSGMDAVIAAKNVEVAEAELSYQRAVAADNSMASQQSLQLTTIDLEFAQQFAKIQAEELRVETERLAIAQGKAKSATALETNAEGWSDVGGGLSSLGKAAAKAAPGVMGFFTTGNPLALLGALPAVPDLIDAGIGLFTGGTKVAVSREDAWSEFNDLDNDKKFFTLMAYLGVPAGLAAGAAVGGQGGSGDDVAMTAEAVQRAMSMGLDISNETDAIRFKYAMEKNAEETSALEQRRRSVETGHMRARLDAQGIAWDEKDTLEELAEIARQQLNEQKGQSDRLTDINSKMQRDTSVLMSIGGSGWGDGTNPVSGLPALDMGGFGGLTADAVDPWSTLSMENGWANSERSRMIIPWYDGPASIPQDTATAITDSSEAITEASQDMVQAMQELSQAFKKAFGFQGEQISTAHTPQTVFTGDVSITAQDTADKFVRALQQSMMKG